MWHRAELGFWVFLNLATMVHAQQVGSPSFVAKALASQAPRDSSDQKSEEEKPTVSVQVNGRVVDRNGKGVANSGVTIVGPKGKRKVTTTNSTGSFSFEGPAGKYTITAKVGTKSRSIEAEVGNENLELPPLILELDP
jgi:Carboxypeptidase regulatory-like domain